jgi:uncharacterized protein YoxC|tara:strand:+ start:2363 stop:2575 length:213 start_codon:yes stop_codon:yes gene_type:complete
MSKIEGHKGLLRDDNNMSIINTDTNALLKSRARKAQHIKQNSEINTLKREVKDMKELLLQINERMKWQEQ